MPHSYCRIWLHIILGVKDRKPYIQQSLKPTLIKHLKDQIRNKECIPYEINGTKDHLHLLIGISPKISVADLVKQLKGNSSHWINQNGLCRHSFAWQIGYGCFSVSESHLDKVDLYIKEQEAHHRKMNFEEEYHLFLEKYGLKNKQSVNR